MESHKGGTIAAVIITLLLICPFLGLAFAGIAILLNASVAFAIGVGIGSGGLLELMCLWAGVKAIRDA